MLKIRLSRFGTKNRPTYRVTISEHTKDALGDVLEYLGAYNPRSNPKFIQLKEERIKYWISKGAQCSATVHNLLVSQGVIDEKKVKAWRPKKKKEEKKEEAKPQPKADEPVAQAESEKKEEKVASEEKPAEEPKVEVKPEEPKEESKAEEKVEEK